MNNDDNSHSLPSDASFPESAEEKTRLIDVSAGLVFRNGLLLITQRRAEDHLGGLWEFPGGKRNEGESFELCLERELREELGIEVQVNELIEAVTHPYPGKTVHLKFFRCAWLANEPRALACQAFAWIRKEQLGDYEFPAADQSLLEKLSQTEDWWRTKMTNNP